MSDRPKYIIIAHVPSGPERRVKVNGKYQRTTVGRLTKKTLRCLMAKAYFIEGRRAGLVGQLSESGWSPRIPLKVPCIPSVYIMTVD